MMVMEIKPSVESNGFLFVEGVLLFRGPERFSYYYFRKILLLFCIVFRCGLQKHLPVSLCEIVYVTFNDMHVNESHW